MKRLFGIIASLLWAAAALVWAMLPYAQGIEARRAETTGSVHESAVAEGDAP